jgi:hypothetical protein
MDAMALLCTLHADGPATLKRLRQAGWDSIDAVAKIDADRLAELLGTTPAAARRFAREAAHLCARLDTGLLEREPRNLEREARTVDREARNSERENRAVDTRETRPDGAPLPATSPMPARSANEKPPALGFRDKRIVEQVLRAWREHDTEDAAARAADPARTTFDGEASRSRHAHDAGAGDDGAAEAARAVHPEERRAEPLDAARTPPSDPPTDDVPSDLFPGAIDGLDQEACLRLRQGGIHDVEMLARADALAISKSLGIGYTRMSRLCALARRAVAHATVPRPSPATECDSTHLLTEPRSTSREPFVLKFSRAGDPTVGALPALAQDLEAHAAPRSASPARTRWSPASAAAVDDTDAGGPFA